MSKFNVKSAATWGLTGLLALAFAAAGAAKLAGVPEVLISFERLGIPAMGPVVGALEIAGAIGLFIPRLRFLALLGLAAIMVGAIGYHLTLDPEKAVLPAIVLFALCGVLAWIKRPGSPVTVPRVA